MSAVDDILFERRGCAGIVTLNRPKALNAITHDMVRALAAQLDAWAHDDAVTRVIVTANGERAFSAGGDIRALYDLDHGGTAGGGAVVLPRGIHAQHRDQALSETVCVADRRHRDGRRRRHFDSRLASGRRGEICLCDAGSRHRLFSGCRGDLCAAAARGRDRDLSRADRGAAEGGGRGAVRCCNASCEVASLAGVAGGAVRNRSGQRGAGRFHGERRAGGDHAAAADHRSDIFVGQCRGDLDGAATGVRRTSPTSRNGRREHCRPSAPNHPQV